MAKKDENKQPGAQAKSSREDFDARLNTAPELAPQEEGGLPRQPDSNVDNYVNVPKEHETIVGYTEQVHKDEA